jgi:lipoate-protein ligase A
MLRARPAGAVNWTLLFTPPASGVENMALDEALMEHARRTGAWTFRVYGWSVPTLSLGRNQRAAGAYDREKLSELGIDVVRRPTGGRAILHFHEVTYAVAGPAEVAGDLHESYARINRLLLSGLRLLGVEAMVTETPRRASGPGLTPCFDHPSAGELVVAGRKLAGSAQWRTDGALLQHGSILVEDDQSMVATLATESVARPPAAATLREILGHAPTLEQVAAALFAAVRAEDPSARPIECHEELRALTGELAPRYRDPEWTWRR